ncbi:MAG: hypothetical protein DRJ65_13385 [Acidobacteria bacterium]|nr:MAG: hypothetical protein DRJ65_13385 [Acidobacteriota bacterium]
MNRLIERILNAGLVLALLVTVSCSGSDDVVIRCGADYLGVTDILKEAGRPAYDDVRDDPAQLIDTVLRASVIKLAIPAKDLTEEEREQLERLNHLHAQQECTGLAIKRALASGGNLEDEARKRFEADPQTFLLPESFRLQMIFIPKTDPQAPVLVQKVLREAHEDPSRFAELARRYSRSETAEGGGFTKPMPGSAVHPDMRQAIQEHHTTDTPFSVQTDRGTTILRVLEYWPQVEGSYEQVASTVRQEVGRQMIKELHEEISAAVSEKHQITVEKDLFFSPEVTQDTPVMTIDNMVYTAGEIIPEMGDGTKVTGPVLRTQVSSFQRRHEAILHFGCLEADVREANRMQVMPLRLRPILSDFVSGSLGDKIDRYFTIHREAFYRQPEWTFDLWVFPFKSGDLYQDLQAYGTLIDRIKDGSSVDSKMAEEFGVHAFIDVTLGEAELLSYEPSLLFVLAALADGEISDTIRSRRAASFLLIRRHAKIEARPMTPEDPGDRQVITARFIADNRDTVMDAFYEEALTRCRVDHDLMRQCIENLSEEDRGPTS